MPPRITHLNKTDVSNVGNTAPQIRLSTIKLEAIIPKDDLRRTPSDGSQVLEKGWDLRRVDRVRGQKKIEVRRKEIKLRRHMMSSLSGQVSVVFRHASNPSSYQEHDCANRSMYVYSFIAVDADDARLATKRRELEVSGVIRHDSLEVVQALCEHPIELARDDGAVAGDNRLAFGVGHLEEHVSGALDTKELARDPNDVFGAPWGLGIPTSKETLELFGKVDVRGSLFLDVLDGRSLASGDDGV